MPSTENPLPVEIVDISLGTMVLLLGIFFVIVGIIIAGVVYRESREWKKLVLPMFDRDSAQVGAESSREPSGLTPRMAALSKEAFGRLFSHMDVAGLLGGLATVILGIIIVLIALRISQ
ncbi:MAG: hypothetical protein HXY36_01945 [Chloroflexi bacterium]|nr:hypothetical protein [Chloroflexota bacterium]